MRKNLIINVLFCCVIVAAAAQPSIAGPKAVKRVEPRDAKLEALADQVRKLSAELEQLRSEGAAKVERLEKATERLDAVEKTVERNSEKLAKPSTFKVSGDFRTQWNSMSGDTQAYMQYSPTGTYQPGGPGTPMFRSMPVNGYRTENDSLLTNRLGLNMRADATENISVKSRFLMYKLWGHETMNPVAGSFFADRAFGVFDGTVGHVPSDNALRVDQAYATINNIGGEPVWFSIGRRPSTHGVPTNLRQNVDKEGDNGGIPAILVDYAFDGLTLGWAPELSNWPGFYTKLCYGRGFDSGFESPMNTLKDTDFLGLNVSPYKTDRLQTELQFQRGMNIFNVPSDGVNFFGNALPVTQNMGDLDWLGGSVVYKFGANENGGLTAFASYAQSKTKPNDHLFSLPFFSMDNGATWMNGGYGLLYNDDPATPQVDVQSHTGRAYYIGLRDDLPNRKTSIGLEYNHGSEYWVGMVPAADDLWTSKLGTRGNVWEVYLIQSLAGKKVSPFGDAFLRVGYQHYDFDYTGSNGWIGAPQRVGDLTAANPAGTQLLTPLSSAENLYLSLDVKF